MEPTQQHAQVPAPLTTSASTSNGGADQIAAQNHHPPNGTADGGVGRVENLLEGAVETLRQLSIIVEDYHEHQPPTFLFDKMCVTYHMCFALPLCSFSPSAVTRPVGSGGHVPTSPPQ
jgi:hypothetical protein